MVNQFLGQKQHGISRKLRLFACACCRLKADRIGDPNWLAPLETAERFVDGEATYVDLADSWEEAKRKGIWVEAANPISWDAANRSIHFVAGATITRKTGQTLASLMRDIFGNPYHSAPAINPQWLDWQAGTVVKLAQIIYDKRRFADLPILADALEEAGCDNPDILAHCRSGGEHVRGCWVVDLLLGKS
jgi:hypothetical protein